MRLIDADALQRKICGAKCGCEYEDCGSDGDCEFAHFIFWTPTVDAEPVRHGKWELNEDGKWACSYCEGLAVKHPDEPEKWQALTTYCPNCGAKMDLEGDNG